MKQPVNTQTFQPGFLSSHLDRSQLKSLHFWCQYFIPTQKIRQLDDFGNTVDHWRGKPRHSKEQKGKKKALAGSALKDKLLPCTGSVILLKCFWFSSHSTNRNAKTSYRGEKKTASQRNNVKLVNVLGHLSQLTGWRVWNAWHLGVDLHQVGTLSEWLIILKSNLTQGIYIQLLNTWKEKSCIFAGSNFKVEF